MHSGRDTDKFTALNLTPIPAEHVDAPGISECPVIVELALSHTLEKFDHGGLHLRSFGIFHADPFDIAFKGGHAAAEVR